MTENEIIEFLKDNMKKGMCYEFFDDKIKDWCCRNFKKLLILDRNGKWNNISTTIESILFYANDIIALPEDKEVEGEWVEFEIRDDGYFSSDIGLHLWFDWQKFLKFCYNQDIGFIAFGGYQYKNCKAWFMQAMLFQEDRYVTNEFEKEPFKTEPAIPVKIRFWRISK